MCTSAQDALQVVDFYSGFVQAVAIYNRPIKTQIQHELQFVPYRKFTLA